MMQFLLHPIYNPSRSRLGAVSSDFPNLIASQHLYCTGEVNILPHFYYIKSFLTDLSTAQLFPSPNLKAILQSAAKGIFLNVCQVLLFLFVKPS